MNISNYLFVLIFTYYNLFSSSIILNRRQFTNSLQLPALFQINKIFETENNIYKLDFYEEVNENTCHELVQSLEVMSNVMSVGNITAPIDLHIQSYGGDLLPSLYVYDYIHSLKIPVNTYIDGFCASAATIIALAGTKRYMTSHSSMLIHNIKSQSSGSLQIMKQDIKNLDQFTSSIKDIYLSNSKIELPLLNSLLESDIWLNSSYCLKLGLVDQIIL
jgi:ATP-dependent Clp protease protease subunit